MTPIHYCYQTSVQYPDIGEDMRLSHRGLLRILQETAARDSDDRGYGLKDIPRTGVFWILAGWRVELLERPAWRTPIQAETWTHSVEGFTSERDFLVRSGDTLVARATSRWLLINTNTGHITRAAPELVDAFGVDPAVLFQEPLPGNGKALPGAVATFAATIGRRDVDTNHHLNNIRYLDLALEALPQQVAEHLPRTLEIVYRRQILPGAAITCLYGMTDGGKHQVELRSEADGRAVHHAYIWLY